MTTRSEVASGAADPMTTYEGVPVMESADFIAICNLMGRYGHIMDECSMAGGPWDRLGEIFTVDATFDVRPLGGPLLSSLEELKAAWGTAVHPWGHHVTNPVIESLGCDSATCDSKVIIILPDGRASTGVYRDRLKRTADGWRITHRLCTLRPMDTNAELPLPWAKSTNK